MENVDAVERLARVMSSARHDGDESWYTEYLDLALRVHEQGYRDTSNMLDTIRQAIDILDTPLYNG